MKQQTWELSIMFFYGTLAIYQAGIAYPFNDWNSIHGSQGFSWRPGSVSFLAVDADDPTPVFVEIREAYTPSAEAFRVIKVPFEVDSRGVALSDLIEDWEIPIPPGQYALFFAIEPDKKSWKCFVIFVPTKEAPRAEIIRADETLSPPQELFMEAEPA